MSRIEPLAAARATCEEVLFQHDLEIVEMTLTGRGRGQILRVTLDRADAGLSVDELAEISEELSRALDLDDPIEGSYTLEVSSAGLERPLVRREDYDRFEGRQVKVRLRHAVEGRKTFEGSIRSSTQQTFVLDLGGAEVVEIPYESVRRTRLVVDWEEELRKARSEEARN